MTQWFYKLSYELPDLRQLIGPVWVSGPKLQSRQKRRYLHHPLQEWVPDELAGTTYGHGLHNCQKSFLTFVDHDLH